MREAGGSREVEGENPFVGSGEIEIPRAALNPVLSRSQIGETIAAHDPEPDAPGEMINRLDPRSLRWLRNREPPGSRTSWDTAWSPCGGCRSWKIIDPEDRELVSAKSQALGGRSPREGHNLLYRIRTERGTRSRRSSCTSPSATAPTPGRTTSASAWPT